MRATSCPNYKPTSYEYKTFIRIKSQSVNVKETHNMMKGRGLSKNVICASRSRRSARDVYRVSEFNDETKKFLI